MVRGSVTALACALLLGACGQPSEPASGGADPPAGRDIDGGWRLLDGRGPEGPIPKGEDIEITMDIDGTTVGGRSACNQYFAEVRRDEDTFEVDGVGGTEMACATRVMEAEERYLDAFQRVTSQRMEGEVLVLSGPQVELLYREIPPVPNAELVGAQWELNGLVYGRGPEAIVSSAEPATLTLSSGGRLTGTTGCRKLEGRWEDRSGVIAVPVLSASGRCPADLKEQDGHVVQVIGDEFTVEIDGRSLTVSDVLSTNGLMYVAD